MSFPQHSDCVVHAHRVDKPRIELCSIQQLRTTMWYDKHAATFMYLLSTANAEVDNAATAANTPSEADRWDRVCADFIDVFGDPVIPPERRVKHGICLHDESLPPPKPRQYRMSQAELDEVRTQLDEYLAKGWVRPSASS